jgi:hypothetical protein
MNVMSITQTAISARLKALEVARGMLDGTIGLVEGCRSLVQARVDGEIPATSAFRVIIGVESETDDYPVESQRSMYAPEFLRRLDTEVSRYLSEVRPTLIDACREIIGEIETLHL